MVFLFLYIFIVIIPIATQEDMQDKDNLPLQKTGNDVGMQDVDPDPGEYDADSSSNYNGTQIITNDIASKDRLELQPEDLYIDPTPKIKKVTKSTDMIILQEDVDPDPEYLYIDSSPKIKETTKSVYAFVSQWNIDPDIDAQYIDTSSEISQSTTSSDITTQDNFVSWLSGSHTISWNIVENIAEKHPYIVALLNSEKRYHCTGSIINKHTVLTLASCLSLNLKYIALGLATIDPINLNENSLKIIHSTEVFGNKNDSISMNVGLIYSATQDLDTFFGFVDIYKYFNYFYIELREMKAVGYGLLHEEIKTTLQVRYFYRSNCPDVGSDFIICGIEDKTRNEAKPQSFGKGAAVVVNEEIGDISAVKGWTCDLFSTEFKNDCHIFAVLGHLSQALVDKAAIGPHRVKKELAQEKIENALLPLESTATKNAFDEHILFLLVFIISIL